MKHINEQQLEWDLGYRFEYLAEFMGFGPEDVTAVHAAAEHLAPVVPELVDAVYDKLFSYDATKRHFVRRQSGRVRTQSDSVESTRRARVRLRPRT